jgi:hypothetical protein
MPELIIPPRFRRVLSKKPAAMQAAVAECLTRLAENPAHPGLRVHRMQGIKGVWEAYVDKANRITFERDGDTITLRNNCNHSILDRSP